MVFRFACFFLLLLPAVASAGAPPEGISQTPRLILLSWDGAGDEIVDRLLLEGELPHLAKLAARGVRTEHVVGTWPTKTAPSHASIYTGCGPGVHGVSSNRRTRIDDPSRHTLLETFRGFSSRALAAEPLFVTTALEGRGTVVLGASGYHPHGPIAERLERRKGAGEIYRAFTGFEEQISFSEVLTAEDLRPASANWEKPAAARTGSQELEIELGEQTLHGLVFDDPADPVQGLDTLLLRSEDREAILKPLPADGRPRGWSPAFVVRRGDLQGNLYFRLFHLAPDGSELVLYRRQVSHLFAHGPGSLPGETLVGATHDHPGKVYADGHFGPTAAQGGDGSAEARRLETVAFDIDRLIAGSIYAWQTWEPRALFHYVPHLDQLGHELMAQIDPRSELYDPRTGPRAARLFGDAAKQMDRLLGALVELGGDDTVVALVSDHGMAPVTRLVAINRILEDAGLLHRDEAGAVDLTRTSILAADSAFFLRVNDRRRRQGIVAEGDRQRILALAETALLSARDPENGRAIIPRVFVSREMPHLSLEGDLYFDTAPGYLPVSSFPERVVTRTEGSGGHGHFRDRRDMHSIFFVAGPGVARDVSTPPIFQIDIAPTLSRLIGMRPPADACGRVLYEALAGDSP